MRALVCRLWAVDGGPDGELTVSEQMLQSQVCTARSTAVTAVRTVTAVPNCCQLNRSLPCTINRGYSQRTAVKASSMTD